MRKSLIIVVAAMALLAAPQAGSASNVDIRYHFVDTTADFGGGDVDHLTGRFVYDTADDAVISAHVVVHGNLDPGTYTAWDPPRSYQDNIIELSGVAGFEVAITGSFATREDQHISAIEVGGGFASPAQEPKLDTIDPKRPAAAIDPTALPTVGLTDMGVSWTASPRNLSATPLPAALPLFAGGLGALGLLGWRRKRKSQVVTA